MTKDARREVQMLSSHWCQTSGLGLGLASCSQTPPHRPSTSPTSPRLIKGSTFDLINTDR